VEYRRGIAYGFGYGLFLAAASLAVHVGSGLDSTELTFYRGAAGFVVFFGAAVRNRHALVQKRAWPLWLRAIASSVSILCYYWTLQATDIGIASSLLNLAPIFVIFLAAIFLSEKVSAPEIVAVLIAVASVSTLGAGIPSAVWIVGLCGSITGATSFTALRASAQRFEATVVVWMLSVFLILTALIVKQGNLSLPGMNHVPVIAAVCAFGVVSQFFQTKAYSFLPAAIASAFGLTSVFWGFCFDVLLFGKPISAIQIASYCAFVLAITALVHLRSAATGKRNAPTMG
jgi:drug/metabolite transporter (DMT)-like permease